MNLFAEHHHFWNEQRKKSLYLGILIILLSLVIQIGAGRYSSRVASSASYAGDLFLDNLPVVNLDFIIVAGALIFWIQSFLLLPFPPLSFLFGLKPIPSFL